VYDADHTLRGELSYWIGARLGRTHCALCDITHGSVRQRPDWKACKSELAVPFDTYHRDDQPASVRAAADGAAPVVVAETDGGTVLLHGTGHPLAARPRASSTSAACCPALSARKAV
jgi:hypothetical protein